MATCKECASMAAPGRSRCYPCYYKHRKMQQPKSGPRILFIDIETAPNIVYAWDLWGKSPIGVNQIIEPTRMICFAAKWHGDSKTMLFSSHIHGHATMIQAAWDLLNEADIVVHYYGSQFDVKHLNREFLEAGMFPPKPYRQVDLKLAVGKMFKFPSNKLQFVSTVLGLDGKLEHEGFPLWAKCLKGDKAAWKRMHDYNKRDVVLLEEVYEVLLPWIPGVPSQHLYGGEGGCPKCGVGVLCRAADTYVYTKLSKFEAWACGKCGSWFRSSKREFGVSIQDAMLV